MLHPLHFSRLRNEPDGVGGIKVIIDDHPLPKGVKYWIRGYSHAGIYYLVKWAMGPEDIDEYATGENLWRDKTPIAYGGGILPLYTPPDTQVKPNPSVTRIWDLIQSDVGAYGLPADIAIALRDNTNTVYF
jgi:hypothetical protein